MEAVTDPEPSIIDFLRARYDEREQRAKAAAKEVRSDGDDGTRWSAGHEHLSESVSVAGTGSPVVTGSFGYMGWELRQYIADNDPQYVLDDLASKRAILDVHHDDGHGDCAGCGLDPIGLAMHGIDECPTLLALAVSFAAHPDYREEWKP